jgi:hypothetical protein
MKLKPFRIWPSLIALASLTIAARAQTPPPSQVPYFHLQEPQHVLAEAQPWEGNEFPHTMSVLELNRDGFRYWGWYGLNEGKGIGLARSNDLVHWTKYDKNPLWTNARWPSAIMVTSSSPSGPIHFAITRDYDTPSSYIVLATSEDGLNLKQQKTLVSAVQNQRNQNPNLFHDPVSGHFFLTFYRGNDKDHFEIISREANSITDLDKAPDKILLSSAETVAAPTLLYYKPAKSASDSYFLATEIYPHRYSNNSGAEWQVKIFASQSPSGPFTPVAGNPILAAQRACLFQHIFNNRFYGYDCRLDTPGHWILEEVEATLQ